MPFFGDGCDDNDIFIVPIQLIYSVMSIWLSTSEINVISIYQMSE